MAEAQGRLVSALVTFLEDALVARGSAAGYSTPDNPVTGAEAFAEHLTGLQSATVVARAALDAARDNRYLLKKQDKSGGSQRAGRRLSKRALTETGVAGLLLSDNAIDILVLATEIAAYLSGPVIPLWNYAIIDADMRLRPPVPVVDGWELVTPDHYELTHLLGVPSAADYVPSRLSLHPRLYRGLAMLRKIDPNGSAHDDIVIYFEQPSWDLWKPLLAISLYRNPVIHLWAQYEVEPARRVDRVFDRVETEPWTPDGVTEVEVARRGDYEIDVGDQEQFRRFLKLLAPLLSNALAQPTKPTKASKKQAERVRRIAEHFLSAGQDAYGEGDVLSELNAEAVLHYVIALEALLTGGDDERTELTRKVVQRAAILAGTDNADRREVAATVQAAYATRSSYAHGSETTNIALPALRRVVRDCILARLVLGDPVDGGTPLASYADIALLDHAVADQVRRRIDEFWTIINFC